MDEDTLEQLIDVVRKFVNERLIPQEAKIAEEDIIPPEIVQEMREMDIQADYSPNIWRYWT